MYFVWVFNKKREDFEVIAHAEEREQAIALARGAGSPDVLMAVAVDGVHGANRGECARHLRCDPIDVESGAGGKNLECFEFKDNYALARQSAASDALDPAP